MEIITAYETIQDRVKNGVIMVVAKAHGCATCTVIVDHLVKTIPYLDRIDKIQVFVDDVDQFRGEHVIFSVPTVLIFSEGKEILRESRFINTGKINRLLSMLLD